MKPNLIMIPGTLCDNQLFKHQVSGLRNTFLCHVVSNSSSSNLQDLVKNMLHDIKGTFAIMGLSYGGIIAFEILRQAPERISHLILLNTNYKKPSETTLINLQRFIGMACLGDFEKVTTHILTDAMLHPNQAKQKELRATVLQMARNVGVDGFFNQVKAQLGRPDSTEDLKNIKCPTLIITGREDKICPLQLHEDMANNIPNAILKIIENCGHLSTLEQPEQVNTIIKKWYNTLADA